MQNLNKIMYGIAGIMLATALVFALAACGGGATNGGGDPVTITLAAIPGVTAPVAGETPVTTITQTAQYTGTVTWAPAVSGTFAANTAYTATIALTPKTGYTLQGVTANFFTVSGATATNAANSGVITVVFPQTFTSITALQTWLAAQPANPAAAPYRIALNVSDLGGVSYNSGSVGKALRDNSTKYVRLDLSGSTITSIGDSAFSNCTSLASITIPNSVTTIGEGAFDSCTSLASVTIGSGVTSIEYKAFEDCTSLTGVTIPNSVTSIGVRAFSGCTSLTSITIPDSVTSIGSGAFHGTLWFNNQPDGVVYAGKVAYTYKGTMPANTSITLLDGTKGIASDAFALCTSLKSVTIPNSVTSIGGWAFSSCTNLTSVTIGNSVTSIGIQAFYKCTSLASVTIPNSVTSIERFAFIDCTSLASVTFQGTISSGNFSSNFSFEGDLRDKYLAGGGGIGTYTTTAPVNYYSVWTKQ